MKEKKLTDYTAKYIIYAVDKIIFQYKKKVLQELH